MDQHSIRGVDHVYPFTFPDAEDEAEDRVNEWLNQNPNCHIISHTKKNEWINMNGQQRPQCTIPADAKKTRKAAHMYPSRSDSIVSFRFICQTILRLLLLGIAGLSTISALAQPPLPTSPRQRAIALWGEIPVEALVPSSARQRAIALWGEIPCDVPDARFGPARTVPQQTGGSTMPMGWPMGSGPGVDRLEGPANRSWPAARPRALNSAEREPRAQQLHDMYVTPKRPPPRTDRIQLPQYIDGQFDAAQWASQQIDEETISADSAMPSDQTNDEIATPDHCPRTTVKPSFPGDREGEAPAEPQSPRTQPTESVRRPSESPAIEDSPGRSVLPDGSTSEDTTPTDQPELCPPEPADSKVQRRNSFQPASPTLPRAEFVRHGLSIPSNSTGAWWEEPLHEQMRPDCESLPTTLESLIVRALEHSAQVQVVSDLPLIRKTTIMEADAAFDWRAFMETRWDDISEPVGNVLTVGPGRSRFQNHLWKFDAGVRRKNRSGGQFEMSQRLGFENSNSVFFVPQNQGTTRLSISYTQPLLRGAGKVYNSSLIMLAEIDTEVAYDEFVSELQTHLLEITRAYWALYLERGALLQKGRLYDRAKEVLSELEARSEVDAAASQIARARAAVTQREADLLRSEMAVRNAEDRIAALVNAPEFKRVPGLELVPLDAPTCDPLPLDMQQAVATAYRERPEIDRALQEIKAASVRLDMSEKELLPQLDLVLETYVSGLRGETDISGSLGDQYSEGQPAYSVGLLYEVPIHNRAAHAKRVRRQLELRQLQNQFRATVETLMLEVKMAVREVDTAYREMLAKKRSMQAAEQRLNYIDERWQHLPGEERSGGLYLEDLLVAQEQLAAAEYGYLMASTTYSLALMNLKRATGMLLQDERISRAVIEVDGLPSGILNKEPPPGAAGEPEQQDMPAIGAPHEEGESVLRWQTEVLSVDDDAT